MNHPKTTSPWQFFFVGGLSLLLTGCIGQRIVWAPDGAHAVVFGGDGLHLCGPDGALGEVLVPGDGVADWFRDSRRLAILSEVENLSWKDVEKILSLEERTRVTEGGSNLLAQLKAGRTLTDGLNALTGLGDYEKNAAAAYLAQCDGSQAVAGTNWDGLRNKTISLLQIRIGSLENGKVALGSPIFHSLRKIFELRISPTGTAIACTRESGQNDAYQLWAIPVDGAGAAQLVAKNTAFSSDWTPDGRSLVYAHAASEPAGGDQISLGSITRREVLDVQGRIEIQKTADDLAGLLFDTGNRVRCLSDGRILFAAAEVHLPCTALDMPQQPQLFALDPERQAGVSPLIPRSVQEALPTKPAYYETSPDGKRIAILADKGAVAIFTLATGALETVQTAGGEDPSSAPSWRSANELCFIGITNGQPSQVMLWNHGTNRVLSANWPAAARKELLDK